MSSTTTISAKNASRTPEINPWLIGVVVSLAAFMEVLDTSIANVAFPHIAGSMGASNDESTWVLTSYLVSNAIVLPISGFLHPTPNGARLPIHEERKVAAGKYGAIGWHTFRHTYRSWLDETGAPMKVQQELMRHASIQTTMNVYGQAMSSSKREANGKVVEMVLKPVKASA